MIKRLSIWAGLVAVVLMIPVVAQFPWTTRDYIFAGTVLFGAATIYEIVTSKMKNTNQRYIVGFAVAMIVFLIWGWAVA